MPYDGNYKSARTCIIDTFKTLRGAIDKKEKELLERINAIEEKNKRSLDQYNKQIRTLKSRLEQASNEFDTLLSPRNCPSILEKFGDFKNKFEEINADLDKSTSPSYLEYSLRGLDEIKTFANELLGHVCVRYLGKRKSQINVFKLFIVIYFKVCHEIVYRMNILFTQVCMNNCIIFCNSCSLYASSRLCLTLK